MDTQYQILSMIAEKNIIDGICNPTEFSVAEILNERDSAEFSQK